MAVVCRLMEIVVRTPHGSADVAVEHHAPGTTLGALISDVTGQAVPAVALVDGRTVSCAVRLEEAGLLVGSLIETDAPVRRAAARGQIVLGQVAGRGAGRTPVLAPGRHRVGPGRRVRADELAAAPVDEVVLEIEVGPDAVATVEPGAGALLMLGGALLTSPTSWSLDDVLVVGRRAFVIRPRTIDHRRRPPAAPDGTTPVHRQPRRPATSPRQAVIDAWHDANGPAATLWERRLDHPDALAVTVGVHAPIGERAEPFVVDLNRHRLVAVNGHESSRGALTRALLVDAVTVHGPADLQLVVITSRPADWDWAKWLPHLRPAGSPMVLSDDEAVAAWMTSAREHVAHESAAAPRTLLVVDGPDAWQRGTSPVRQVVSAPPAQMSIVALGDDADQIPEHTDLLLAESAEQHWTATSFADGTSVDGILAALVELDVAGDIARLLASCSDPDRPTGAAPERTPHTLDTFVTNDDPDATTLLDSIGLGTSAVVVGPDVDAAARATAAFAMRVCLTHSPESLVLLDLLRSPWTAGLTALPHTTDADSDLTEIDPDRLVQRLEHRTRTVHVLALVDGESPLGSVLSAASRELPGLSVLTTTTEPTAPGEIQPVVVTVHHSGRHRRAVVQTLDRQVSVPLDDDGVVGDLVVRPFAVGRLLSPLERRVDRRQRPDPIHFVEECRRLATELAREPARSPRPTRPPLLPPAMPALVETESLLRDHPGDGIPIGVVDDVRGDPIPLWWIPGHGSVVAVGAPSSGVAEILGTVLVGLVDRFGVDDVEFVLVDQSAGRRRTAGALQICSSTAAPNDDDSLVALVGHLEAQRPGAGPPLVVAIDDLGFLLRRADRLGLGSRLRGALGSSTTSVVATARSIDDIEPLPPDRTTVLIGYGFADPAIDRPPRGRCRRQADGALVQLAALDQPLGAALAARAGEGRA
jgi:hypothetical protein